MSFQIGDEPLGLGNHWGGVRSGVSEVVYCCSRVVQRFVGPAFGAEEKGDVVAGQSGFVNVSACFVVLYGPLVAVKRLTGVTMTCLPVDISDLVLSFTTRLVVVCGN